MMRKVCIGIVISSAAACGTSTGQTIAPDATAQAFPAAKAETSADARSSATVPAAVPTETPAPARATAQPLVPATPQGRKPGFFNFAGSNDMVTAYYLRGYQRDQRGFIDQPSLTVFTNDFRTENLGLRSYLSSWNSFDSALVHRTGSTNPGVWYESDIIVGSDLDVKHFVLSGMYTLYTFPKGGFREVQESGTRLEYDDRYLVSSGRMPLALLPYVAYYSEMNNTNSFGRNEAEYWEVGLHPEMPLRDTPITLRFPMALGMSGDQYYRKAGGHNATFGFSSFGADVSVALPVPENYGTWNVHAGVTYLQLYAPSARASNGGGASDWVGSVGIGFVY